MSYAGRGSREARSPAFSAIAPTPDARPALMRRPPSVRIRRFATPSPRGGFVIGIAVGLLVGAGIGWLTAPTAGAEARRYLARRGRRLTSRGRDVWGQLRDELHAAARLRHLANRRDRFAARERPVD
jgi:hypothetical protein